MEIKYRRDLYKLLPKKPYVAEIGVAEGFFSADMCAWGLSELTMVDLWEPHPEFPGDAGSPKAWHDRNYEEAMKRVQGYKVRVLRGPSVGMASNVMDRSLDLVYIDACHSYECVRADIQAWWPKLKAKGIMAFHDYINTDYGVNQAVNEFARWLSKEVHNISEDKPEDAGAWISQW